MSRIKQFREIFATSFKDPARWVDWFFANVATDDNRVFIQHDGSRPASALYVQDYDFAYAGRTLPSAYISCVATRPEFRGKGLASQLMVKTLRELREKGYAFAELIPQTDALYFFYAHTGFSGCVYRAEERYSAVHSFASEGCRTIGGDYALLHRLEEESGWGVRHSEEDFRNVLADLDMEPGHQTIATEAPDGSRAMLFASLENTGKDSTVLVHSLLAESQQAADAALAELRKTVGERPMTVLRPASDEPRARLRAAGMVRITDPLRVLGALADAHRDLRYTIRLTDRQIPENCGIYTLRDGICVLDAGFGGKADLEVDIRTLTAILFSPHNTGAIFSLPTRRPYMALMLD